MKFTATIDMSNAAFDDAPASELARILEEIARRIRDDGQTIGLCRDINGNTAGNWSVTVSRTE